MNGRKFISKITIGIGLIWAMTLAHAGTPLWTFTPLTATSITVAANDTATIKYQVTNQSKKPHTLVMKDLPGITQITTSGNCLAPFVLDHQQSCTLTLSIQGSALNGNINGGPVVCNQGNPNQCYQPSAANGLHITKGSRADYTVGGSVFGLLGTLVLENNGGDALTMNVDGSFTFANTLPPGSTYLVTVQNQPTTQTCTVTNGSGVITSANITNITVHCSTNAQTIGGSVSGLAVSESVVLQNNGGDNLSVNSNGSFTFSTPIAQGAAYNVTILTQPSTQTCTVTNGSGTVGVSNITNVQVTCATNAYTVGGTVSGLNDSVSLQNNGGDDLLINNDGSFTFPTSVAQGASYNVTVLTQPTGQTCTVTNGTGTMGGANVTNVAVNCVTDRAILSTSVSQLALSVTGLTEYGINGTISSGLSRIITIRNIGTIPAVSLSVSTPSWPSGTTSSRTCGSTLAANATCTITINPGSEATSDGSNPCSSGTAPVPGTVQVNADNSPSVAIDVVVLSYGCVYQDGYVYALDDTTPTSGSVGGSVVATSDQAPAFPNGVIWSSNGSGGSTGDAVDNLIYGISELSTTSSANPSTNQVPGQIACNGATDGLCDTNNVYLYYPLIDLSYYAVGLCKKTIDGHSDWYLPAICEMGYASSLGCGTSSTPTLQNIQSSLINSSALSAPRGYYWSSTGSSILSGSERALSQLFDSTGVAGPTDVNKEAQVGVRCVRALTF